MMTEVQESVDFGIVCVTTRTTDTLQLVVPVSGVMTPVLTPVATEWVDFDSAALAGGAVGVGPGGLLVAWTGADWSAMRLRVRDFAFDGAPAGAEQTLDPDAYAVFPRLAVGADGRALLGWERSLGSGTPLPVEVASRPPGGAFGAPVEVLPDGSQSAISSVALDAAAMVRSPT